MNASVDRTYNALWPRSFLTTLEAVEDGAHLTWLGGAGFALKTPTSLVWIDPFFGPSPSERALRMIANPVDPRFIRRADAVLSSHDYTDHCEQATLVPIAKNTRVRLIRPAFLVDKTTEFGRGERVEQAWSGETLRLAEDLPLTICPCNGFSEPYAVSFLSNLPGSPVYYGADGFHADFLKEPDSRETVDVAILAYGRKLGRDVAQVLRSAPGLNARTLILMHWDIWTDFRADPAELVIAAKESVPQFDIAVLTLGKRYTLGVDYA